MSEIYILLLLFHWSRIDTDNCSKMRALQKQSDTPRTTSKSEPPHHRFVAEIETITTFHV